MNVRLSREYIKKKEKYFSFLIEKISTILPNLEENIDHKEIGTPKTHKKFLGRYEGSYGPIPVKNCLDFYQCLLTLQKLKTLLRRRFMLPRSRAKCSGF